MQDLRSAARLAVKIPALIEKIGQQAVSPDLVLAPYFERISPDSTALGLKVPGVILDLSPSGAFIAARAFPLMSRLAFTFPLTGFGQVDAVAWVLWRRTAHVTMDTGSHEMELPAGIGVLFEAIPLAARQVIADLIAKNPSRPLPPAASEF